MVPVIVLQRFSGISDDVISCPNVSRDMSRDSHAFLYILILNINNHLNHSSK